MLRTRIIILVVCAIVIWLLFMLPKAVVENESEMATASTGDSVASHIQSHAEIPSDVRSRITDIRKKFIAGASNEKNAIFADSLADLYSAANQYDSAAWFAEEAATFFNTTDSWTKAGNNYYQAYTLAIDGSKQQAYAAKAQEWYGRVLKKDPDNLQVKNNLAMTYITTANPMQGIRILMDVLKQDPKNEQALFNMGMLSIQSGQHDRAIARLEELLKVNPKHLQGNLLLAIAYMNSGDKAKARDQFEKVKQMDKDPAVQATVDSYLKDLAPPKNGE
jgi:outer membrane protein